MATFTEQISSNRAVLRFDVVGGPERTGIAEDMSFLNYRLGAVEVSHEVTKEKPDIIWYYDEPEKSLRKRLTSSGSMTSSRNRSNTMASSLFSQVSGKKAS